MQFRPGRESDFTHLETFVWQAIFPAFDVPGLTEEQQAENDAMVAQATTQVLTALEQPEYSVFTAWDERRRSLAGYLILEGNPGEYSTVTQLIIRRSEWGKGVGEGLLKEALQEVGPYQGIQLAVRAYNARAIAFFAKHDFTDTGESAGDYAIDRILMIREAVETPAAAEATSTYQEPPESPVVSDYTFPTEADAPYRDELPDYSLTVETDSPFDPADSFLDDEQRSTLEDFIAKAKARKEEQAAAGTAQKKNLVTTDLFSTPSDESATEPEPDQPSERQPDIPFEVVGAYNPQEVDASSDQADEVTDGAPTEEAKDSEPAFAFDFAFAAAPSSAPAAPPAEPSVPEPVCLNCGTDLPPAARFCPNCGTALQQDEVLELREIEEPAPAAPPPPEAELTMDDVRTAFEDLLGDRLTAYFGADKLRDYLAVYCGDEKFRQIRDVSLRSLTQYMQQEPERRRANRRRDSVLAGLVEYFVVETSAALHSGALPQRLLRYQSVDWAQVDLFQLVLDYLDMDQETETVYTDFVTTPQKVLRNATQTYLRAGRDERLLFICDQSLLGNGKQGFALTDSTLYWKNVLQPAGAVTYTTLGNVVRQDGHLLVDGQYFDAGARLNLRVAVLLDKLRHLNLRGE